MDIVSTEKFVENLGCDLYPITIIKFMLNKRKIMSYFSRAARDDFSIKGMTYKIDHSDCPICQTKKGMLCRQHTSIQRILDADNVAFDLDTNVFFYKNEIFRLVGNRLVIIYCPHPKLIVGKITDEKVRKIIPITVEDQSLTKLPNYKNVFSFISSELMHQHMKCWFNNEFHIVSSPDDRNSSNFFFIPNT